jgi:Concanavalin A-like lectin/glucanases superfamily/Bacterial Ig-like domain (group 2)/Immunoglobulin I-set domain
MSRTNKPERKNMKKASSRRGFARASNYLIALAVWLLFLPGWLSAQTLQHRYSFVSDASDSVGGASWNGSVVAPNGGTAASISNGLTLPGGGGPGFSGYVTLPAGILNNTTNLTVECWVTQNNPQTWAEVWSFNNSQSQYIGLIPHPANNGGNMSAAFRNGTEYDAFSSVQFPSGSEQYVAVSFNAATLVGSLYNNGALLASVTVPDTTYIPGTFNTLNNVLGQDPFADPQFQGTLYELRIWNGVLSPLAIAVNSFAGPALLPTNYVPTTVYFNVATTNLLGGQTEQGDVTADFAEPGGTLASVEVTVGVTNWSSSNPGVVTVSSNGLLTAVGAGNATVSATVAGVSGSVVVFVAAVQPTISQDLQPLNVFVGSPVALTVGALGGNLTFFWFKNGSLIPNQTNSTLSFPSIALADAGNYSVTASNVVGTASSSTVSVTVNQQSLDHRYSMDDSNVIDSIAGADGTPLNGVTFSNGMAIFPGTVASGPTATYIALPSGLISGYSSLTFEMWATIQPNGNWNEICTFGDQSGTAGNTYIAVIPHSGAAPNDYRMTIRTLSVERATSGATPIDTGTPVHITAVYDADTSQELLYANAVLVSTLSTTIDIADVNNLNSWLGRSMFDGDAGMKGSIDEFRIWNGPLTPLQIAVNDGLGPNNVSTNAGAFLGLTNVSVGNNPMVGGTSQQATALANFANVSGVPFNVMVTNWSSSNTNVATVSASGVITAVGQGGTLISATALGSTASVSISVLAVHPTISQQPAPQTRYLGGSVQFAVVAAGGQLTYQWLKTGSPIANATNSQFAIIGLANTDAADYSVVVTNSAGSITSSIAHLTVSGPPAGYAGAVIGDGPVAYWRLDETSGTNLNDTYNNNNGTYSGAETLGAASLIFGSSDPAVTFAGGTATVPYNPGLNPSTFTIEFWAEPTALAASYVLALQDRSTGGRRGYAVQFDNVTSGWDFTLGTNNTQFATVSSGSPVQVGTLYHVVASYDGTTARLYVNGVLVNSAPIVYAAVSNAVNLTIASRNGNNAAPATLDEVSLYNYAFTSTQVSTHYALGRSGTLAPSFVSNPFPGGSFKSVVGLPQKITASVSGQMPLTTQWLKNGVPIPGATGTVLTLLSLHFSDAASYTLQISNAIGTATSPATVLSVVSNPFLVHRWSFTTDGTDSISGSNATLVGSASYSGGQLVLPGGGSHVSYATVNIAPTFAASASLTFEGWYTDSVPANWAKVWMFGASTANYIDFTPQRGANGGIPSISFNPFGTEVNTAGQALEPPVLTAGTVYHAVAAYDSVGNKISLYLNGVLVATNNMLGSDLTHINASSGLFGESLFGDPDLTGSLDEMRVWRGVLSPAQVAATDVAGTSSVPDFNVSLGTSLSGSGTLTLTWSSGMLLEATNVTGPWTPVPGATSPYSVSTSGGRMMFYQVQVQ